MVGHQGRIQNREKEKEKERGKIKGREGRGDVEKRMWREEGRNGEAKKGREVMKGDKDRRGGMF